ncbi:hypothetical protein DERF_006895, partial [Dermatophagoides farinae]
NFYSILYSDKGKPKHNKSLKLKKIIEIKPGLEQLTMAHLGMNKDDSRYLEFTMNVTVDFKFQNFNLPLLNIHNQCGYGKLKTE